MSLDNVLYGYLDVPDTPPEPEGKYKCDQCGDDLHEGDYVYIIDQEEVCENCKDAYLLNNRRIL